MRPSGKAGASHIPPAAGSMRHSAQAGRSPDGTSDVTKGRDVLHETVVDRNKSEDTAAQG